MKTLTLALAMTIAATGGAAQAATHEHDMSRQPPAIQTGTRITHDGAGVLKEIDANAGKLKIAHEPIAALHWPAMTMWFALQGTLPHGLKAGERVHFSLQQIRQGEWVITRIERRP